MKKIILTLILILVSANCVFAAKIPDTVKTLVKKDVPQADFRFDGLVIMPDGSLYLPLFPALVKNPETLQVQSTIPENKTFKDRPDIIILNNDFAFLKVLVDQKGRKTVLYTKEPPIEIRTGLLPQDMLVPTGLIIPDNIKGIIGNLQIPTAADAGLRIKAEAFLDKKIQKTTTQTTKNLVSKVPQLQNKTIYVATCYSKNIQVIQDESSAPEYALAQKNIPIDIKATPDDKFLLVTAFSRTIVDIISLADERTIKQIDLTTQGGEIAIDRFYNRAFVASPDDSSIYIIDLHTMTLRQKIKVRGMCERLIISDDCKKLFYADKKTNNIWAIELNNNFVIKDIGSFPNISKIAFTKNKIYVISRTKNCLAIIDYDTLGLIKEMDVETKPIDMISYKNNLYVLSAQNNAVQVIDTATDEITNTIFLNTNGFSTKIHQIKNTNIALVMDTKTNKYSVLDLDKKIVIRTNFIEVPVSQIVVTPRIRKINK